MHSTSDSRASTVHWSTWVLLGSLVAFLLACVVAAFAGCAPGFDAQSASATKGTPDAPCGNVDQVCDVMPRWQDDTCCAPNTACPGPHAGDAPPGTCEDSADFDPSPQYGAIWSDAGARKRTMHPIRKAVP